MSRNFYTNNPAKLRGSATDVADSEEQALKRILAGYGIEGVAMQVGMRPGQLYDASDPFRDAHLQARRIAPLTLATGRDDLIQYEASQCGGVFVRIDSGSAFNESTAEILQETADVLRTAASAEADGVVTKTEASAVRHRVNRAQAALEAYARWMESRVEVR